MPSAIINIGYLSNEKDINLILSAKGQDKIALSIANAIINFGKHLIAGRGSYYKNYSLQFIHSSNHLAKAIFQHKSFLRERDSND